MPDPGLWKSFWGSPERCPMSASEMSWLWLQWSHLVPKNESVCAYKIFILLPVKVSACIVTTIWTALTNSLVWSQFPLNGSGSAALVLQIGLLVVWGLDRYAGLGVYSNSLCHCWCHSQSYIGNIIPFVCNSTLDEGVWILKLLQLFLLALEEWPEEKTILTEGLLILIWESVGHDFRVSMCVGSSI